MGQTFHKVSVSEGPVYAAGDKGLYVLEETGAVHFSGSSWTSWPSVPTMY
ncbi:MAG: hypothetical protein R2751_09345 [Bacteroidales bacterium]